MAPRRRADLAERTVPAGRWTADQSIISISVYPGTLLQAFKRKNVARSFPQIFGQIWKRYTLKFSYSLFLFLYFFYFLGGFFFLFFSSYYIQHCFIWRPSDSTVPMDAGIEPSADGCWDRTLFFLSLWLPSFFIRIIKPTLQQFPESIWIPNRILVLKCRKS